MKYQGSKNRISKQLLEIINTYNKTERNIWIEPFVGGANMIDKVATSFNRVGCDNNKYIIRMFQDLQDGWIPPEFISDDEYKDIKNNKEKFKESLVGFVGIGCSFAGKWFGGYARGGTRNYCAESQRNLLKQKNNIKDVEFFSIDYRNIPVDFPNKTIIYCDPPYEYTTKYHSDFNHKEFWEWAKLQNDNGALVFVSEYNAPEGWKEIWSKEVVSNLDLDTGKKRNTEKLFVMDLINLKQ